MAEKKEYRSAVRSRRMIQKAFLELLDEKPIDKITVLEVARRADVNRSTFYAHYQDIFGVAEAVQDDILQRNLNTFSHLACRDLLRDPLPCLQSIADMLEEMVTLNRKIGRAAPARQSLEEYSRVVVETILLRSDLPDDVRGEPAFAVRVQFFLGGISNTFLQWAEGKLDCPKEVLCEQIARIIRQSAADVLEKDETQQEKTGQRDAF